MTSFIKQLGLAATIAAVAVLQSCSGHSYETVPGDPLNTRIYTLDNGLKVYMTVNKDEPRVQTYIAVRVGGKNDPAETTGLAHYFEHLMFKGTTHFGTQNYEAEKPLLDQIEKQFEVYRTTTDSLQRRAIYATIDSLSQEASKYAIPNEYDKLMSAIGATGTNAYTSYDVTCYTENIPSNEIDNWAKIQADRFKNCVIRGFHTELETVYEEYNMSLTNDMRKVIEGTFNSLFPHHPYGTQTILGTQEHLKNPSITNIKNYYKQWYVPNNMAICLSGDIDPEQAIATIDKYFGDMKPNPNLPKLEVKPEEPINQPIKRDVTGLEAEMVTLGWRIPAAASADADLAQVVSLTLYNGQAGLIDLDITQQQKALGAYCFPYQLADCGAFFMAGQPKAGQSLDEVKDLLLAEVDKLRRGDFDEKLLQANINNFKLGQMQAMDSNEGRADWYVNSFVNGTSWSDEVTQLDRLSKLTKEDVMAFADKYLSDSSYVVVYKHQGIDPNQHKIDKPVITPIAMNRDTASTFLREMQAAAKAVKPIEPVFVDYAKDLSVSEPKPGLQTIYKQNTSNDVFQLIYIYDLGSINDKLLGTAGQYLNFLGTSDMTAEEVRSEFYRLACGFSVNPGSERSYITLSGLNENMPQAVALLEKLLNDAQVDKNAYNRLVENILKQRTDDKSSQWANFNCLTAYMVWGAKNPTNNVPTEKELRSLDPQKLIDCLRNLSTYKHRVAYYGPSSQEDFLALLDKEHKTAETLKDLPESVSREMTQTPETTVYIAPYNAKQIYMLQYSNDGRKFDPTVENGRRLYNEYFGGGMNAIVFQEMRESRSLAYTATAGLRAPGKKDFDYCYQTFIATQNDKMADATTAFNEIINDMPISQQAFDLARNGYIARLRTDRIIKSDVIWSYINAQDLGLTTDYRISLYDFLQNATMQDVIDFQQKWVKGRTYHYGILGDKRQLDMKALKKIGPVVELTPEQIFGY